MERLRKSNDTPGTDCAPSAVKTGYEVCACWDCTAVYDASPVDTVVPPAVLPCWIAKKSPLAVDTAPVVARLSQNAARAGRAVRLGRRLHHAASTTE